MLRFIDKLMKPGKKLEKQHIRLSMSTRQSDVFIYFVLFSCFRSFQLEADPLVWCLLWNLLRGCNNSFFKIRCTRKCWKENEARKKKRKRTFPVTWVEGKWCLKGGRDDYLGKHCCSLSKKKMERGKKKGWDKKQETTELYTCQFPLPSYNRWC